MTKQPKKKPLTIESVVNEIAGLLRVGLGLEDEEVEVATNIIRTEIEQLVEETLTSLYRLRASIPLTGGEISRRQAKILIDKLKGGK